MSTWKLLVSVLALVCVLLSACLPPSGGTPADQFPQGIWEGAQEAGDVDWSMSLHFEGSCTEGAACAKVYYVSVEGGKVTERVLEPEIIT